MSFWDFIEKNSDAKAMLLICAFLLVMSACDRLERK